MSECNKGCFAGVTVPDPPDSMKDHPLNREDDEQDDERICRWCNKIISDNDETLTVYNEVFHASCVIKRDSGKEEKTDKLKEVYEKYKYLDEMICDSRLVARDELPDAMLYDLRQAVKEVCNESKKS